MQFRISLATEDETRRLAEDIAAILRIGDVIALEGDLGAGKTTFARFLLRAFADNPALEVPSPTFTLAQSYPADTSSMRLSMHHFDLYRLESSDEIDEIGLHAALEDGAALVEWPQRAGAELPYDALWISLEITGDMSRSADLTTAAPDRWRDRVERTFAIRQFLDDNGAGLAERRHLTGDASARVYERIRSDGQRRVLMNAPALPDGPPVRDGLPYSRIAHLAESVRPFVAIGQALRDRGLSAPALSAVDMDQGLLLLEDLGNALVVADNAPIVERYEVAIDLLAAMHEMKWPDTAPLPDGSQYRLPPYDEAAFLIEAELYPDWYVPHVTGEATAPEAKAEFVSLWRNLVAALGDCNEGWVLRDFHSPNLIWLPERDDIHRIGLIDFQDALVGPSAYDVAALCQDARVDVEETLERHLVDRYCASRRAAGADFDAERFHRDYAILAAQRATKILGIFARLNDRDAKPIYLRHIPRLNAYLDRCLAHPILAEIRPWYQINAPETAL